MKSPHTKLLMSAFTTSLISLSAANSAHAFAKKRSTPTRSPSSSPTPAPSVAPTATPSASATPGNSGGSTLPGGAASCVNSDPNHICIGLKIVSYLKNNVPSVSQAKAITMIAGMNQVWNVCNIAFQLEKYEAVDPTTRGLTYNSDWENDGDRVRSNFQENNTFLVVAVGTLTYSTIAVTEMPGAGVYGTLVESAYATNALTVGHELGHYQGLYHISNTSNLMNPYIGTNTSGLSSSQCSTARSTDYSYWQNMMRH